MAISKDFADYCCELLSGVGTPIAKRMFGGWAIYIDGLSIAWIIDLSPKGAGNNEKLYLKASDETRTQYEAAGCERFAYLAKGKENSLNYYSAPDSAMESPREMLAWARLALSCALEAKNKPKKRAKRPHQGLIPSLRVALPALKGVKSAPHKVAHVQPIKRLPRRFPLSAPRQTPQ